MARDLITGTSPTDWSRNGHGILGAPLAMAERAARCEAQAFKLDLVSTGTSMKEAVIMIIAENKSLVSEAIDELGSYPAPEKVFALLQKHR
jgi:hypothetical protein